MDQNTKNSSKKTLFLTGIVIWVISFIFPGLTYGNIESSTMSIWEYSGAITGGVINPLFNSWMFLKFIKSHWVKSHSLFSALVVASISAFLFNPFLITVVLTFSILVSIIGEKISGKNKKAQTVDNI